MTTQYALVSPRCKQQQDLKTAAITYETIKQRQDLQKSVLRHTNKLINQLLKNLNEADNVIKKNLSPGHLQRLISYLRNDIEPLPGFVSRISLHAENLGSMKKEFELQKAFNESLHNISFSTIGSDSQSSFTRYMIDRAAREPSPIIPPKSPASPYHTPRARNEERENHQLPVRDSSPRNRRISGYVSKCTSPVRFADGDVLDRKDSSEQVDLPELNPEEFGVTQLVRAARQNAILVLLGLGRLMFRRVLAWKFRLTGSRRLGKAESLVILLAGIMLYRLLFYMTDYSWKLYKSATGMRRGIRAM
ncbi:hypothetical protein EB796_009927 [Bugula neritina]|uniref:Uncharacterized protein n=1 Tax=Bugula neritina TaxID=10212 RepID=A0A7J7JZD6_BUGNE|nr:hypothetical protein EB796_009927 [Bugula neritina]